MTAQLDFAGLPGWDDERVLATWRAINETWDQLRCCVYHSTNAGDPPGDDWAAAVLGELECRGLNTEVPKEGLPRCSNGRHELELITDPNNGPYPGTFWVCRPCHELYTHSGAHDCRLNTTPKPLPEGW